MSLPPPGTARGVHRMGLGLAAVGRPGYLNLGRVGDLPVDRTVEAMRRRTHALLDLAYARGVRYVDTARSYGRAEEFLAEWLAEHPEAGDLRVGSKWGYTYTAGWRVDAEVHEIKDHSLAAFEHQHRESGELLGERLDLYQIHSVTPESPALSDSALLERLGRLSEEGVTVGLSTSGPRQAEVIRRALRITPGGRSLFRAVQCTYNVLEPSAGEALEEARAAGWTVIVKEALANGRLAGAQAPEALRRTARECGVDADVVALAAVLRRPWVEVVLSGAATTRQLESNLAAVDQALTEEQVARLGELAEEPGEYWRERGQLAWS
ncbi:aldo/keto reductase [Streptomyces sp. NPDC005438]|uniref:aldo/keto reductase n=1 Tax=Streptomyces sp. NPDC005438 TaxID=3156880 RepID=UPI0033AB8B32